MIFAIVWRYIVTEKSFITVSKIAKSLSCSYLIFTLSASQSLFSSVACNSVQAAALNEV